ncbi:MAG: protein-disulfide reductase DsbD family protein [Nevskia sp.]|nr:protein-disulfide reductase DsbD family protein [Nevskia sp.]
MRLISLVGPLSALLILLAPPAPAAPVRTEHVEAELIAENQSLRAGGDNWLALRIVPDEGWHVYWRNPGDSGLATSLSWTLPAGVSAGELQWPYPHRSTLGDIANYGYDKETLLPVALQLPADWAGGPTLPLHAKAKWLVCKDICIPGSADLALELPVVPAGAPIAADPRWRDAFSSARTELPQPAPADWKVQFAVHGGAGEGDFSLAVKGVRLSAGGVIEFFPYASDLVKHSAPQRIANSAEHGLRISQKLGEYFARVPAQVDGVLVVHDGSAVKAWEIHAQPGAVAAVPQAAAGASTQAGAAANGAPVSLLLALLSALLGGLILNLMPCVFPVLSIKAISLIEARGKVARHQRAHAVIYTLGVLTTFGGLAGLLLALRGSGAAVGWGFQLQQPVFVTLLAYLFFAMGLSMSGLVQFGTRFMGVGQGLAADEGYRGSFFTGVLAVVVASPCAAPFMGTALGYALSQPPVIAIAVFVALGLGLALPFLLIGFFPRLGALLPRPGAWMETFKQVMAFPLYFSVVWLVWVLGGITDRNGMAIALLGLTLLAFALWLWNHPSRVAQTFKLAAMLGALALLASPQIRTIPEAGGNGSAQASARPYEPWSEPRVTELRGQGRTVFVDFTADWCITCKVNERVALKSGTVQKAFGEQQVAWLQGDWTRADPAITELLAHYGRSGVPLYLLYIKGGEPKVLPQILTPAIVLNYLGGGS